METQFFNLFCPFYICEVIYFKAVTKCLALFVVAVSIALH